MSGGRRAVIHTDGSCAGSAGPGGWAAVIRVTNADGSQGEPLRISGGEAATTNNRMEMTAVLEALRACPETVVEIVSDSQYVLTGMSQWRGPWKSRGWRNAALKPVKNRDLWKRLDALAADRQITWTWIKGHAGHPENEEVDRLASEEAVRWRGELDSKRRKNARRP